MLIPFGTTLTSDAIRHRFGFDGREPEQLRRTCDRYAHLGIRSAFAINTTYEEIQGGYYVNRALFGIIDSS